MSRTKSGRARCWRYPTRPDHNGRKGPAYGYRYNAARCEFARGKKPRGRGCRAFGIGGEVFWSSMNQSYAEAVSNAKKVATTKKVREVMVLP
jgi:hypothetical protein